MATIGSQSILAEFQLANSMEPLQGLKQASRLTPKIDKPLTKKAVKNLKCNKCSSGNHYA